MKAIKLLLLMSLAHFYIHSMQETKEKEEGVTKVKKKLYQDKHKYDIDYEQLKKLPKVLFPEIFSYLLNELNFAFEYTLLYDAPYAALSRDGKFTIISDKRITEIYDIKTGVLKYELNRFYEPSAVVISSDEKYAIASFQNLLAIIYNLKTGTCLRELRQDGYFQVLTISPNDNFIISGDWDGNLRIWDIKNGILEKTLILNQDHGKNWVHSIAISSNNKYVVADSDKTAQIWDLETDTLKHILNNHDDTIRSIAISSDDKYIVTGSEDGTANIWDFESGELKYALYHNDSVRSVAISPDNKYVITGSFDKTAKIWSMQTGALLYIFEHNYGVDSVAISPDGKYAISLDNTWKIEDQKKRTKIFIMPQEQLKTIRSLSPCQLALMLYICSLKKINPKDVVRLNNNLKKIFESLPEFMQKSF